MLMISCTLLFEEDYKNVLARLKAISVVCTHMRCHNGDSYYVEEIRRHLEAIERVLTKEDCNNV